MMFRYLYMESDPSVICKEILHIIDVLQAH
jgi:hypothetical protein